MRSFECHSPFDLLNSSLSISNRNRSGSQNSIRVYRQIQNWSMSQINLQINWKRKHKILNNNDLKTKVQILKSVLIRDIMPVVYISQWAQQIMRMHQACMRPGRMGMLSLGRANRRSRDGCSKWHISNQAIPCKHLWLGIHSCNMSEMKTGNNIKTKKKYLAQFQLRTRYQVAFLHFRMADPTPILLILRIRYSNSQRRSRTEIIPTVIQKVRWGKMPLLCNSPTSSCPGIWLKSTRCTKASKPIEKISITEMKTTWQLIRSRWLGESPKSPKPLSPILNRSTRISTTSKIR